MKYKLQIRQNKKLSIGIFLIPLSFFIFFSLNLISIKAQQTINVDVNTLLPKSTLFFSPRTATILEGSTMDVSVYINTQNTSVNAIRLNIKFDPTKLAIVRPSNSHSIIGIFIDPPKFSNTDGTMNLSGIIPNGIKSDSGLIVTMTFKAIATGQAVLSILPSPLSKVLVNDGEGTEVSTELDRASFTIMPVPPEGPVVFSETHPFQDTWYNNNNPQLAWEKDPAISGFSYTIDNKPFTVPGNDLISTSTIASYENLPDGIYYFHIKAKKQGIWGLTTNYTIRIDTTPPAGFTPRVQFIVSSSTNRVLISFYTTDALSGRDHYEVGVVDKDAADNGESPVFQEVDSPYQFILRSYKPVTVVVRAFDKAGNSIDESIDVIPPSGIVSFLQDNWIAIILSIILLLDILFGHRIIPHMRRIFRAVREEERMEVYEHEKKQEAQEYLEKFSNEKQV